jgi:amino acid transporter
MINREKNTQTPIIERPANYKPPRNLSSWLIGRPLSTADAPHETIGKAVGLAVFASDALSSNAYATQEILVILAIAGMQGFQYVVPISIAIVVLLAIVATSYIQVIHAYPQGGGGYIVARDNLGEFPALVAASSLLMDYVLVVSVSVSSGVAQITSAYPDLYEYRVPLAVASVFLVTLLNLRGLRETGTAIIVPNFFFIIALLITLGTGMVKYLMGSLGTISNPPEMVHAHDMVAAVTPFLVLHAFSSGTAALTGIEAISTGITAFKEPRSKNAAITLTWMAVILSSMFLGISFLSTRIQAVPSEYETVISQIARTAFGGQNILYTGAILGTTIILMLAANTAFAGFPRLSALMAKDGFMPRQLTYRGSRLVYSRGVVALALVSAVLIVVFQASVTRLIPLYAIGVFLSFTIAQSGMALRWWRSGRISPGEEVPGCGSILRFDPFWKIKMLANGFGAFCTAVVMMVFAVTKFKDGAYIVMVLIPLMVAVLWAIHRHYNNLAKNLSLENIGLISHHATRHRVIMPVSGVHQGTLAALRYARMLSDDVTAVHVVIEPADAEKVRAKWETWGGGVRMVLLDSPYRLFIEPILKYISDIADTRQPGETITVVVPEFVSDNQLAGALHTNTADILRNQLKNTRGLVITNVPYHIHEESLM